MLGYTGSGGPTIKNSIVAGIAAPDYWQGVFGLEAAPSNFTTLNDPQPSFMHNLRNQSLIPSLSWGYTAGAAYRYNKVQGSLTLGGYDTSRFGSENVTFDFYPDVQRRFVVGLNSITYIPTGVTTTTTSTTLMSEKISLLIDSTIPYIYLPESACARFESAFGLQWNDTSEIYTVNDTQHTALQKMNPNITFTLANTAGETLDIVLPYEAFDLTASFPVVANETLYFPLKRAANDTQYTLGRTFLQEAYLIADYDRSEFSVSPCMWPSTFNENIKAILPPGETAPNNTITITLKPSPAPAGAIAGGVIGGVAVLILASLAFFFFYWKPRHQAKPVELSVSEEEQEAKPGTPATDPPKDPLHQELDGVFAGAELPDIYSVERKKQGELAGTPVSQSELASPEPVGSELDSPQVFEMPAREAVGSELSSAALSPREMSEADYFEQRRKQQHQTYYNP
jgi:hypothetical protein